MGVQACRFMVPPLAQGRCTPQAWSQVIYRGKASGGRTPPWLILPCSVPRHLSTPRRTFNVLLLAHRRFCLVLKVLEKSLRSGASLLGFKCQLLHLALVGHEASLLTSPGVPSSKRSVTSAPMLHLINGPVVTLLEQYHVSTPPK